MACFFLFRVLRGRPLIAVVCHYNFSRFQASATRSTRVLSIPSTPMASW